MKKNRRLLGSQLARIFRRNVPRGSRKYDLVGFNVHHYAPELRKVRLVFEIEWDPPPAHPSK